jgi:hypothetical protein
LDGSTTDRKHCSVRARATSRRERPEKSACRSAGRRYRFKAQSLSRSTWQTQSQIQIRMAGRRYCQPYRIDRRVPIRNRELKAVGRCRPITAAQGGWAAKGPHHRPPKSQSLEFQQPFSCSAGCVAVFGVHGPRGCERGAGTARWLLLAALLHAEREANLTGV